jgi:large subunit ribosomal protein L29
MKAKELREKSTGELKELLRDVREARFRMKMQLYTGQLENTAELGLKRRDIARVHTILRQRELAEAEAIKA